MKWALYRTEIKFATRFFFLVSWDGVRLRTLVTPATIWPIIPDYDKCGAVGGIIGRGNRSTRKEPAAMSRCPPRTPHGLTRARTRAAAVGSQRLTAWAMAWPTVFFPCWSIFINVWELWVKGKDVYRRQTSKLCVLFTECKEHIDSQC
jgi:hypothetical protein